MTFIPFECTEQRTLNQLLADFYLQQLGRTAQCDDDFTALEREFLLFRLGVDPLCEDFRTNQQLWMDFFIDDLTLDFQCDTVGTFDSLFRTWLLTEMGEDMTCEDTRSLQQILSDYLFVNIS